MAISSYSSSSSSNSYAILNDKLKQFLKEALRNSKFNELKDLKSVEDWHNEK